MNHRASNFSKFYTTSQIGMLDVESHRSRHALRRAPPSCPGATGRPYTELKVNLIQIPKRFAVGRVLLNICKKPSAAMSFLHTFCFATA